MSTKTMRPPSRRVPLPLNGAKRKERDDGCPRPKSSSTITKLSKSDKLRSGTESREKNPNPVSANMLLAGYLAHEFLSKGTLLGRRMGQLRSLEEESQQQKYERYVELTLLLKTDGAQLFDIVNPNQLAHFLKL
ncbi:unnamed protein product [Sphenostylis stenocarpa]|uniref:Uncharacterized protein n=1 Tax=Sphenostylis stenocarpa TaxID=92480 RepID=A0AA86SEB1_9FABA|nr:unnamed protein product [Sphenostylis stenocarpa]